MRLSPVFYVFLVRMAVGTVIALLPLWRVRAAERHIRFQLLLTLCLAGGAAALYLPAIGDAYPSFPHGGGAFLSFGGGIVGSLLLLGALVMAANVLWGTYKRTPARVVMLLAIAVGLVAVWGTTRIALPEGSPGGLAGLAVGGLLGGLFMAGMNNAMILGHFFLMIPGLPVDSLRRAGWFTAIVLLVRIAYFGAVLLWWDGAATTLFSGPAMIWTAWRIGFGMVGPLALLFLVKDTVKLKNTQAATGLLYVAVAFALLGELAAVFLESQTGIPV